MKYMEIFVEVRNFSILISCKLKKKKIGIFFLMKKKKKKREKEEGHQSGMAHQYGVLNPWIDFVFCMIFEDLCFSLYISTTMIYIYIYIIF
jgi:hypothetical protein